VTARPNARQRAAARTRVLQPRCPITVIVGPPAAGKSTLAGDLAGPADVIVDLDLLALAISAPGTPHHRYPDHVRYLAVDARTAVIRRAAGMAAVPRLWIIHAHPDPETVARYCRWSATFVVIDPGEDVVLARCAQLRPPRVLAEVRRWYDRPPLLPRTMAVITAGDLATASATIRARF
jgi:hypothetical protein